MGKGNIKVPINTDKQKLGSVKVEDPAAKDKKAVVLMKGLGLSEMPATGHWNKRARIKWTFTMFLGAFLIYSVRTSMSISITALAAELGWNKKISGMVLSSFFAGYVTTNVLGGYLADKYGGEKVMLSCSFVWATMNMLVPLFARYPNLLFATNTFGVVIARFLTGVGQGMHFPSATSIVTRRNPVVERSFVWSTALSGAAVGTIFSGFAGSFLIESLGWPSFFLTIGLMSYLWIYILRYLVRDISEKDRKMEEKSLKPLASKEAIPWRLLFSKVETWGLLIVYFCNNLCFYNLLSWLPLYFHETFPKSKGWIFNVIPWLASFIVSNLAGLVARKLISSGFSVTFVRKLCTSVALFGGGSFLLLLDFAETFEQALFLMTVILGIMAFANVGPVQNSQDLAPKFAGALYGVMNTVGAFSGIIGVYVSGHMLEAVGKWSAVFHLSAGACFFGAIIFLIFGSGERIV